MGEVWMNVRSTSLGSESSDSNRTIGAPKRSSHVAEMMRWTGPSLISSGSRVGWMDACIGALVTKLWPIWTPSWLRSCSQAGSAVASPNDPLSEAYVGGAGVEMAQARTRNALVRACVEALSSADR